MRFQFTTRKSNDDSLTLWPPFVEERDPFSLSKGQLGLGGKTRKATKEDLHASPPGELRLRPLQTALVSKRQSDFFNFPF